MTEEYERVKILQNRGPAIRFEGRLIASDDSGPVHMEIYETVGGALVAVTRQEGRDFADVRATVVEPDEEQAMRFAVMEHFDYENRAKTMVRKQLKWKLTREVA